MIVADNCARTTQTAMVRNVPGCYDWQSSAVFSRSLESTNFLRRKKDKQILFNLVQRLSVCDTPWSDDQPEKITAETSKAAFSFLNQLPPEIELPKISPDGEGSLVMLWENDNSRVLLTIEDWRIHMVKGATSPQAEYYDNLPFAEEIPEIVFQALPRR